MATIIPVFGRDIVLGNLVCCDFGLIGIRSAFHAVNHFGLETLPFLGQLFDALGICTRGG